MADNRKEQERAELHRTIWNIANDLRGSVDGWDFKQYVLGMLFYRYISENIAAYINAGEHEAGDTTFDYAHLSDEMAEEARTDLVETKGFFILPSALFENVRANAPDDENLNETLENVFKSIEAQLVPNSKIAEEDYNLSVSTNVEQKDTREVIDIVKLNAEIEEIVTREDVLRREIAAIIAEIEGAKA